MSQTKTDVPHEIQTWAFPNEKDTSIVYGDVHMFTTLAPSSDYLGKNKTTGMGGYLGNLSTQQQRFYKLFKHLFKLNNSQITLFSSLQVSFPCCRNFENLEM